MRNISRAVYNTREITAARQHCRSAHAPRKQCSRASMRHQNIDADATTPRCRDAFVLFSVLLYARPFAFCRAMPQHEMSRAKHVLTTRHHSRRRRYQHLSLSRHFVTSNMRLRHARRNMPQHARAPASPKMSAMPP